MQVTSYGAARGVTGSKHVVEVNGHRILMDCGMHQGRRKEAARFNQRLPFDAAGIDTVLLSHAHIDHSGILPMLSRHGFEGRVFTTPATRDLCAIMLLDSAHIQERDAQWLSKKNQSYVPPIYTDIDVREIMRRFICIPYDITMDVAPGVRATFQDAGHVLGSAMIHLDIQENGRTKKLIFSGDIGRKHMPILKDPWEPGDADVVLMESTYGGREHDPIETLDNKLDDIINRTHDRGGKVIVPTFALERAQEFIYALKRLESQNRLPHIKVFVDSPLTVNITEVFRLHTDLFDEQMRQIMEESGDPFELRHIEYVRNVEASKRLNSMHEPMVILSAAGMCEHGRILHHLRNNCEDKRNTICIIGYQAEHTLGRKIVERHREIRIFGIKHELRAEVQVLNSLSAHAGHSELVDFGARFKDRAGHVLLVHGEDEALNALKEGLEQRGCTNVAIQEAAEPVEC